MKIVYSKAQDATAVDAVNTAVEELKMAMVNGDSVTLDKLSCEELSYGYSGGRFQNKKEFIQTLTNHLSAFSSTNLSDQVINIVDDFAIVRHTLSAETKGKRSRTVKLNIWLVWKINSQGIWRLLAGQALKLP